MPLETNTVQARIQPVEHRNPTAHTQCPMCATPLAVGQICPNDDCAREGLEPLVIQNFIQEVRRPTSFPLTRTWSEAIAFDNDTTFDRTKSQRRFGVEIETSRCDNHEPLRNLSSFNCVRDGSVDGLEFVSVPMKGDNGLAEVDKLCEYARENNWQINSACGLHVHLDATDLSNDELFKVAWAYLLTYDLWSCFLPVSRKNNYYCAKHFFAPSSLELYNDFETWVRDEVQGERYCWINFSSYLRHGTIELRNHTASLNGSKINNWIRAHLRFIDTVKDMTMDEILEKFNGTTLTEQFEAVAETWGTNYMRRYYRDRAHSFGYLSEVS